MIKRYEFDNIHHLLGINLNKDLCKVLHFNYQDSRHAFSIWVEDTITNPNDYNCNLIFSIYATGDFVQPGSEYVNSIIMPDGFTIFHCYYKEY